MTPPNSKRRRFLPFETTKYWVFSSMVEQVTRVTRLNATALLCCLVAPRFLRGTMQKILPAATATTQPSGRYTYRISFSRLVLRLLLSRFSENLTEIQTHLRSLIDKTHLWKCIRIVRCLIPEFANLGVYAVGPSGRVTTIPNRLFTAKR